MRRSKTPPGSRATAALDAAAGRFVFRVAQLLPRHATAITSQIKPAIVPGSAQCIWT